MTSLTIQIEDGMSAKLKAMAEKIGVGIDNYIMSVLSKAVHADLSDVDSIVKSMQLQHGNPVPAEEDGKGAVAYFKHSA
jgi:hypothetical protein